MFNSESTTVGWVEVDTYFQLNRNINNYGLRTRKHVEYMLKPFADWISTYTVAGSAQNKATILAALKTYMTDNHGGSEYTDYLTERYGFTDTYDEFTENIVDFAVDVLSFDGTEIKTSDEFYDMFFRIPRKPDIDKYVSVYLLSSYADGFLSSLDFRGTMPAQRSNTFGVYVKKGETIYDLDYQTTSNTSGIL